MTKPRLVGVVAVLLLTSTSISAQQTIPTARPLPQAKGAVAGTEVLNRSISVRFNKVSLENALATIGRLAGATISYSVDAIPAGKRVSLVADKITVREALLALLQDTGVEPVVSGPGFITLEPSSDRSKSGNGVQQGTAAISGYTRDSATGAAIPQVSVRIDGTTLETKSRADGRYQFTGIAAGEYRVTARRVGYVAISRTVTLSDGQSKTLDFQLNPPATKLDEVVTTALGDQRRYTVGNVISTINVDSIAPTAPVTSVTDLISARAPGVEVIENSGILGSGESIRIRGISSLELQSDPIVIVDGVRQDNSPGSYLSSGFGLNTAHPTPSRLNDLDFSDVATIDILKGPTATTEYGTDAANGVIVITTKHGTAGTPLWHADAQQSLSGVPERQPDKYYSWGHLTDGSATPENCTLGAYSGKRVTTGNCVTDSITQFNPLNTPTTTLYTMGDGQRYDLSVGGGSDVVRYFVSGEWSGGVGAIQMPPVFRTLADSVGVTVPGAALHSNTEQQRSIRLNTAMKLNPRADLSMNVSYLSTATTTPDVPSLLAGVVRGVAIDDAAHLYGYCAGCNFGLNDYDGPLSQLSNIGTDNTTRLTGGATLNWRPTEWFVGHVTAGIDHGLDQQQAITYPTGNVPIFGVPYGTVNVANNGTDLYTLDWRVTATASISSGVQSVTSGGLQIAETRTDGVTGAASNITLANLTLDGYPNPSVNQTANETATLGWYGEEEINLIDRLFLIAAVRVDGASGFGDAYAIAAYPKASFSWLVLKSARTTVRLRGAFGESGQQPSNGASEVLFYASTAYLHGASVADEFITWPGNPDLRPERSEEYEGGIDIGGWGSRVSVELTAYQKMTHNALNNVPLSGDLCCYTVQENLGEIQNNGIEATATFGVIQSRDLDWDVTINASADGNKLVTLAPGALETTYNYLLTQNRAGYPLYSNFGNPIFYTDANHDGIIEPSEVRLLDSATYDGPSSPTREASLSTHVGLWHGALSLSGLLDYKGGYRLFNANNWNEDFWGSSGPINLPTAPLWEQARALGSIPSSGNYKPASLFENGSFLRFRELSVTYAIPRKAAHDLRVVDDLSLTVAVRNLALWTRYSGIDPETSNGGYAGNTDTSPAGYTTVNNDVRSDFGDVPLLRSVMCRLNVGLK